MGLGFGRGRRLRTRSEFDRVFRRGRRLGGPLFLLIGRPNEAGQHRLGLAVSRRVGGAVIRNRARRLLRESFRRLGPPSGRGFDLVVVARPEINGRTQAEVDGEFRDRVRRLVDPGGARRASHPGPH